MGCTLASSARINKTVDSRRGRIQYDSSFEDSDALEESAIKSKWLMNKVKGAEEKKTKAIEYRRNRTEQAKQDKINAFRKKYEGRKPGTKNDRTPAQQDDEINKMVVDTSFEEDVVQHIEGALVNLNRKVEAFPYQVSGRIGLRFWGKVIIQEEQFVDDVFPPHSNSLFDPSITEKLKDGTLLMKRARRRKRIYRKWKDNVVWKRPDEVYGVGQYCVFGKVEATDVTQGSLGDCYFLSSVAAIAENPHRIKQMFHSRTVTDSGAYAVKLYVNGEPVDIVIDDYFPFDSRPERDHWMFSRDTSEKEIWVQILEKAYAKAFGSYEIIEGGKPYQALTNLTGFPTELLYHNDLSMDNLWRVIKKAVHQDQPMVCSINSKKIGEEAKIIKIKGLADHHAYSLISVWEKDDIRLVKIRDPYGTRAKREWQLDWKNQHLENRKLLEDEFGVDDELDGVFWMQFENFRNFFYITAVSLYQDNYQQITLSDTHGPKEHAITKLIIHEDITDMFVIKLQQIHRRFLDGWLDGSYQYATMQLYMARVERVGVHTPDDQFEENTETVKLVDGARGIAMPLIYMRRNKILAGEYLLFYRAAFISEPGSQGAQGSTPASGVSSKAPTDDMAEAEVGDDPAFFHSQRKLVLSVHFPSNSKLQMQRIETEPFYGKDIFTRMRRHYKQIYEQRIPLDEDDLVSV